MMRNCRACQLLKDYFINLCYEVRGEQRPAKKIISALDVGIEGIEDDSDEDFDLIVAADEDNMGGRRAIDNGD